MFLSFLLDIGLLFKVVCFIQFGVVNQDESTFDASANLLHDKTSAIIKFLAM